TGFKLRSEHVVRTLDVGVHATPRGGLPYIVMELLDGQELGRRIDTSGAVPVEEAVELVLQACEALASAHALGIVHRDLKPSNLFLVDGPDGKPSLKVLDFGISKVNEVAEAGQGMTTTDAVLGSPGYMPPEQLRASRDVDARADVWSLGMVLWEMLVGKPMFAHETFPEICAKVLHGNLPTPREAGATLPEGLEAVILRALASEPAARHPTVLAFAEGVSPFLGADASPRLLRIANLSKPPRERGSSVPPMPPELSVASTATSHPAPSLNRRTTTATPVPWGVTESSVQADPTQHTRRRGRGVWIAAGAAAVAAAALTFAVLGHVRRSAESEAASPAAPTSSVEPTPSPPPPPPSSASATPASPPAPAPSGSAAPTEHARVSPPRAGTAVPAPASSASSGTRPANGAPILR
ncbi:MAG TPA: serine/threonine-protein kinase, partial [Polyangiaceae bacterium]|nr:serine/threonine-protein kinase [Polyangiaceae bacterium]